MKKYPVILIGAGPACIAAAIQLRRSNISFLMIAKEFGGLIANANLIENLLGFPHGITGVNFVKLLAKQMKTHSVEFLQEEVQSISIQAENYLIETGQDKYTCSSLIIGTGTLPKKLGVPEEADLFVQKKLFYEIKNIPQVEESEEWVIIGGGDAAYDYALNISNRVEKITIVQRGAISKALPLLLDRVKKIPKIEVLSNARVHEFRLTDSKIHIDLLVEQTTVQIYADRILVAIGRKENLSFLPSSLLKKVKDPMGEQSLFFVGDVKNHTFRQVSIAMGDGLRAAMILLGKFK